MKNLFFDKYLYYFRSVQSPSFDVNFMHKCYKKINKKIAYTFREDFCFTFALSCEWIKLGTSSKSIAIDLEDKPLKYGKKHYLSKLNPHQQKRVKILHSDVLKSQAKADIICALNFSYFIFKQRNILKKYFLNSLKSLNQNGLLILDCFGGSQCLEANEEQIDHKDFIYYWEQKNFDPISHYANFQIHYKRKKEKKRLRVFNYNWRLWTIPEIKELLLEVGYKQVHIYWEGTNKNGTGNNRFTRKSKGEECDSWIAYIVAEKSGKKAGKDTNSHK